MEKIQGQVRQGDVLIHPVTEIPEGAVKVAVNGRLVLAEGEVTGHAHAIEDLTGLDVYEKDGILYMKSSVLTPMKHEEHGEVSIAPGIKVERRLAHEWSDAEEPIQVQD